MHEREAHFEALRKKAKQIENGLPGATNNAATVTIARSASPQDPTLRQLEDTRRALESRLTNVPPKIATETTNSTDSSSITTLLGGGQPIDIDRVSISSSQGVTLAMEVLETDTEQTSATISLADVTRQPQHATATDSRHRSHLQAQTAAMRAVSTSVETVQSVAQLEASLKAVHQRLTDDRCLSYDNFSKQQDVLKV